ncbi:response regulator transcription factor [Mariniluteicoccus endophyticus]
MRIFLTEDAALIRAGLQELLESAGHEVGGVATDAVELVTGVEEAARAGALPDIVVTDVRMPPNNSDDGLRAAVRLRERHPGLPVLVLSAYVSGPYARTLLDDSASGGVGYLLKERVGHVADFLSSLEVVAGGGVVVDPEVVAHLTAPRSDDGPLARLTPREREVLQLMAAGLSNSQIGEKLFLSQAAVGKHVANVFAKLDLPPSEENRRVRAVLLWLRHNDRFRSRR